MEGAAQNMSRQTGTLRGGCVVRKVACGAKAAGHRAALSLRTALWRQQRHAWLHRRCVYRGAAGLPCRHRRLPWPLAPSSHRHHLCLLLRDLHTVAYYAVACVYHQHRLPALSPLPHRAIALPAQLPRTNARSSSACWWAAERWA